MSHHWLQVVNDNYSVWGDKKLMDDLLTFFCTNGRKTRLCKKLADRIGNTQRASKETQKGYKRSFHRIRCFALFLGPWHAETKVCGIMHTCQQVVQRGSTVQLNP